MDINWREMLKHTLKYIAYIMFYLEEINNLPKDRLIELNKMILCYYYKEGKLPKFKPVDKFLSDINKHFIIRGEGLKRKLLRLITVV